MFGKIMDFKVKDQSVVIYFDDKEGKINLLSDEIVNVYAKFEENSNEDGNYNEVGIVNKRKWFENHNKLEFKVEKEEDYIKIVTKKLIIKVYDDFKVDFFKENGEVLCKDYKKCRNVKDELSSEMKDLLAKEGHEAFANGESHSIEVVKEAESGECFYGLGDRTGFLNKKGYAYELWNTDEPRPQVDSFKTLYKSIPFMINLNKNVYGIFFDNTYRTFWDFEKEDDRYYYFAADKGNLNYYFIAGDEIKDVVKGYTELTGTTSLPQLWTLGYHQSRWGYESEDDIRNIAKNMRNNKIPCDVIHLDIDYMDEYKVFTWNKERYKDNKKFICDLGKIGFKIVTIIDPGVKKEDGYYVYEEGKENNYFVKDAKGDIYVNQVWPGDAVYPDFGKEDVRKWWADKHKYLVDLGVRGVWNDMNEPASFKGEIPKDVVFFDENRKTSHEEMHNIYGSNMSKATYEGLKKYDNKRPFVITRACYAGAQKYTTTWTGDNHSIWAHLQMAIPQMCNLGLSGIGITGTDVGGFGSDATKELVVRWYQVGCFSPLFRNHSARGTRNQEPWQFDKETLDICRKYVKLRYALLPYFYDLFVELEKCGAPVLRPLVFNYQNDKNVQELNDEFMVGEDILVAPVVTQGTNKRIVYLPKGKWIDYETKEEYNGETYIIKNAPIDVCPIFIKKGSIIPNYEIEEYVGEKKITELVLDVYEGKGGYIHYQDDTESFNYQKGEYNKYKFSIDEQNELKIELIYNGYNEVYSSFKIKYKGKVIKVAFTKETVKIKI